MTHDEALFQRINQTRAKLVGALRVALNGAGLKERGSTPTNLMAAAQQGIDHRMQLGIPEGYDIERLIQAATALRAALEPFDASVPQRVEERA